MQGTLRKMLVVDDTPVRYTLPVGEHRIALNERLGQTIRLEHTGRIVCIACGRETKKSFNQGYCFPCFKRLARCDICIVRPEQCHYDQGTCREPDWGLSNCMQTHYVYLANSSGVKVGITRGSQLPTRWLDQGASQALPLFTTQTRYQSGLMEIAIKKHVSDRTDWRKMLKGAAETRDLAAERDTLLDRCAADIERTRDETGDGAINRLDDAVSREFEYPVLHYPTKVKAHNFDKIPIVEGTLAGIKGQ
jgi:Protein of unknown function (DUF2797)